MRRTAFGIELRPQLEEFLPSIALSLQKGTGPAAVDERIAASIPYCFLKNPRDFGSFSVFFMYAMLQICLISGYFSKLARTIQEPMDLPVRLC